MIKDSHRFHALLFMMQNDNRVYPSDNEIKKTNRGNLQSSNKYNHDN